MSWRTPLDADVPVALSRANYDRTRRKFYEVTGAGRDDERWPLLVPPGASARPHPTRPEWDEAVPPEAVLVGGFATPDYSLVEPSEGRLSDADPPVYAMREIIPTGQCTRSEEVPGGAFWSDMLQREVAVERTGVWRAVATPEATPEACAAVGGRWEPGPPVQRDHIIPVDWWYETDWGREVVVTLYPPLVLGQYAWEPVEITPIPTDNPDIPALVAVPYPHPYVVGGPEPLFVVDLGTSSGMGDSGSFGPKRFGIYQSPAVLTGRGDRHSAKFYGRGDPFRGPLPDAVPGVWRGHYFDEPSTEWYEDALQEVASTVARSAALSVLVQIVGTYVTAGGASAFIGGALQAAGGSAAGQAAGASAVGQAGGGYQQATGALDLPHAQGATGPFESSGLLPSLPSATLNPLEIARQAPEITASVVAPEQTNEVLAVAAEASVYLDAMGSTQELWNMTLRELTIRAQRTQQGADELRLRLVALEAEVHGAMWFTVAQTTVNAVMAIAGGIGIAGMAGEGATAAAQAAQTLAGQLSSLARLGASAASMLLRLEGAREAARAMRERLEEEAHQRARDTFLAIPTTSIAESAPPAALTPARANLLWLWSVVVGAAGYAVAGVPGAAAGAVVGWLAGRGANDSK